MLLRMAEELWGEPLKHNSECPKKQWSDYFAAPYAPTIELMRACSKTFVALAKNQDPRRTRSDDINVLRESMCNPVERCTEK